MGSNLGRFLSNLGQNLVKIANVEVMIFEDMCLSESVSAKHWGSLRLDKTRHNWGQFGWLVEFENYCVIKLYVV